MLENHDLGKHHKIWAKLHCLPKFFWAGTPMVIYWAFCYFLKFNLLILPEERMNFKLNNIPGNSIYIEIDKMNDGHLGLNSFRLDFGHGKIQSLIRRDYERFQSSQLAVKSAMGIKMT